MPAKRSLSAASAAAEQSARTVRENLASGLASPLEYRVTQNAFLKTRSGLLDAVYQHNLASRGMGPRHRALFSIFRRHRVKTCISSCS